MARNPAWTEEELILALDVYVRVPRARSIKRDPALAELSRTLQRLRIHRARPDPDRFRNLNSVYLKLQNFKTIDPGYPGLGMRAGATRLAREVWDRYAADPQRLAEAARLIIRSGTPN
jgi:5-methylcytosine-specific restriction enzyme A